MITELAADAPLIKPLRLEPFLSDDEQLLRLEHADLDIDVFAHTRTDLWNELRGQLGMLWQEYGLEDNDRLSGPAIALKEQLNQLVKHQADGTR